MELFFTVQFSMIWRLAKDHNFTQILTLSKYGHLKGPKLKMNNLKRPKYRDICIIEIDKNHRTRTGSL